VISLNLVLAELRLGLKNHQVGSYFPEPMWGQKQREVQLDLPSFKVFFEQLKNQL
jgi:hypothetical protein